MMSAQKYRSWRHRLGLSAAEAAALCGVDERTERRWASGELRVPNAIDRLFRLYEVGVSTKHFLVGSATPEALRLIARLDSAIEISDA